MPTPFKNYQYPNKTKNKNKKMKKKQISIVNPRNKSSIDQFHP